MSREDELRASASPPLLASVPAPGVLFGHGLRLLSEAEGGQWALFLGATLLFQWAGNDRATRRLVAAQIVNAKLATQVEVGHLFGLHPKSVGRIARHVATEGVAATIDRLPGPRGPHKVTPAVLAAVEQGLAAGLSSAAIAEDVRRRLGISLTRQHVLRLLHQRREQTVRQQALDLADQFTEAGEVPEALAGAAAADAHGEPPDNGPAAADGPVLPLPGETVSSRYMGLTLFYVALEVGGLLAVAEQVYQFAGMVRLGVRQVFLELFCLALLQEATVERVKHLLRSDLGVVLGCGRAACVRTLRRKLALLCQPRQAAELGRRLAQRWLEVGLLNASFLYVDGHMKLYSGKRQVQQIWNSQRRMPLPGIEQYFVNDLRGRPLLVVTEDISGNLAKSLPQVIQAIREVLGDQRHFTVIFDRGGYDGRLFGWLVEEGLDFITYQRGEVALARDQFHRHEVRWEGQRVRFWLAEDEVTVAGSGPWRRIVLRTADGHQTPILTSLGPALRPRRDGSPSETGLPSARVVAVMLARWRQENCFKALRTHVGLDVLASHAADPAVDREVPNPAVKLAKGELQRLLAAARKVRAAVGHTVMLDTQQATTKQAEATPTRASGKRAERRGLTQAALLAQLQTVQADIAQARERLKGLPQRVQLSSLGDLPATPRLEAKVLTGTVKVAAYNAQLWLADRLAQHYPRANDRHDLVRAFGQLSGAMTREPDGTLRVRLDPPDIPLHRRALAGLCDDLNHASPHFPGTDIPLAYEVAREHFRSVISGPMS
ncbi:MAG: putative transposase [Chloroflexota bacterium]